MPRRSRKSNAAIQRHAEKNAAKHNKGQLSAKVPGLIRGNFHQGDLTVFSAESAGRQCSCNALVTLCMIENIFDTLMPCHLDHLLQIGDQLYKTRCNELEMANDLHSSKLLDQTQLPSEFSIEECIYTIDYQHNEFRHGRLDADPSQRDLNMWLQYAFTISNRNILLLDGYMMAIYKHSATEQFLFFDSHSRNEQGIATAEGTSVAIIFNDLQAMLIYLLQLVASLQSKYFGVQPIVVHSSMQIPSSTQHSQECRSKQSNSSLNPEDTPGCSSWDDDSFNPPAKSHAYKRWFNNLPEERKKQRLQYQRCQTQLDYAVPEKRRKKQQRSKIRSRRAYAVPEQRVKKQQRSKIRSRRAYAVPEQRVKKQQRSKIRSRRAYAVPEQRVKKQQRSKIRSHRAYAVPEQRVKKQQRSKIRSRRAYAVPEQRVQKQLRSKSRSRRDYALPEKRTEKQARLRRTYAVPEKRAEKQERSRRAYAVPEKKN